MKTLQVRVKDKHASVLNQMAREINFVWNFVNETSQRAILEKGRFMSGYDLQKYTKGYCLCDGVLVNANMVEAVCVQFAAKRRAAKRARLRWRVSNPKSSKKSLGWVPFRGNDIRYKAGQVHIAGMKFSLWDSYGLADFKLRAGCFSQDSRGRWYLNVAVEVESEKSTATSAIGIDLGLKTAMTTSTGQKFEGGLYRASEQKLACAQRAHKKRRVKAIHAKIQNQRKDGLHKFSTQLVKENAAIFVGDVSSTKMIKTHMAKSTLDAGWSIFKRMLEQKSQQAGIFFEVVDERYSTQTCSQCGSIEGPKGVAGLGIRRWQCSCGVEHDRDVNAAQNIARRGLAALAEGAALSGAAKSPAPQLTPPTGAQP